MGDFTKAKNSLERALNLAREIGNQSSQCNALESLSLLSHYLGIDQVAFQYSQDALHLARVLNLSVDQVVCLTYAGHAMLNLGRIEQATENYLQALALAQQSSDTRQVIEVQAGLAQAYLVQGHRTQALEVVEEILDRLALKGQVGSEGQLGIRYAQLEGMQEPFRVLLTCCRVLQANHDRRAEPILGAAYRLLLEQSNRLPAGQAQMDYLEMIPAHRELRRLYGQLAAGLSESPL
jgi:tetratricopeptide (TPR) repeat protein